MHERKVEMAKRVNGFVGLPGGFGTFEEVNFGAKLFTYSSNNSIFPKVMEVTTWTQLGIHDKREFDSKISASFRVIGWYSCILYEAVVLLNVLSFWDPLRVLVKSSIDAGFIKPSSERLIIFVDGPEDKGEHESYDWGKAALDALDSWERGSNEGLFTWATEEKREAVYGET